MTDFPSNQLEPHSNDYYWLSSMHEGYPINYLGRSWPTRMHLFQALRCKPGPRSYFFQERIRLAATPQEAMRLGGRLPNNEKRMSDPNIQLNAMAICIVMSLKQHELYSSKLSTSKGITLIEPNRLWNNSDRDFTLHPYEMDIFSEPRQNVLGTLWMNIRDRFLSEDDIILMAQKIEIEYAKYLQPQENNQYYGLAMSMITNSADDYFNELAGSGFDINFISHAKAILRTDFPQVLHDVGELLAELVIPVTSLVRGGGGETVITQDLRNKLAAKGWRKHKFEIEKLIDKQPRQSISHEVDHVRRFSMGTVAMEIEWNNKDPFFDRDLENFKRLHAEGAISAGIIITRGSSLHRTMRETIKRFAEEKNINSYEDLRFCEVKPTSRQFHAVDMRMKSPGCTFATAWSEVFVSDKYGQATTHWAKLEDRVKRGVGNPCPLLLIGIPQSVVDHSA